VNGQDLSDQITAAYERDRAAPRRVTRADEVPPFYEAITTEWLAAIMCRDVPGAKVTGFSFDVDDDGTTNRRRIYLDYNDDGQGLPASVFCKGTFDLPNRTLLSSSATFSEVSFFNRIRGDLSVDAPTAYHAAYDPESWASIIVMRDIAADVEFCSEQTVLTAASILSQLQLLATLHGKYYDSPRFAGDLADIIPFHQRFHNLDTLHGIGACCREGLDTARDYIPAKLHSAGDQVWAATERAVQWQRSQPETFTHGDVHLKNWYRRANGEMGIGDWQASGRGHWARDIAYLLGTALPVERRRAEEKDFLKAYLDMLADAGGPRLGIDDAYVMYRAQMLAALAWWTMTLTPSDKMPDMQPLATTRVFVQRLAAACDDLESVAAVERLCAN